jgi:hypothetical protein
VNSAIVYEPLVAAFNIICTSVVLLGVITIVSIDVKQEYTVSTNVVVTAFAAPALVICPVTVVVYTPASVGAVQATTLVAVLKVINDVLWPALAVIAAVYTMSDD